MSDDPLQREQYADFLIGRAFRGSVLCNAGTREAVLTSAATTGIRALHVAGNPPEALAGNDPHNRPSFQFGDGPYKLTTADPGGIELLRRLCRAWPSAISFAQLQSELLTQRESESAGTDR